MNECKQSRREAKRANVTFSVFLPYSRVVHPQRYLLVDLIFVFQVKTDPLKKGALWTGRSPKCEENDFESDTEVKDKSSGNEGMLSSAHRAGRANSTLR